MCDWTIMELIFDAIVAGVSVFAIIQYKLNRYHLRKSAATVVYNQLKSFDEYIDTIKSLYDTNGEISDYHLFVLNPILAENHWAKNKHLLVEKLTQDDITLIDKTYTTIESLEIARNRIIGAFTATSDAKSYALQFQAIQMLVNPTLGEPYTLSNGFNKLTVSFESTVPRHAFKNMVGDYRCMLGTPTLENLRGMSYQNKKN